MIRGDGQVLKVEWPATPLLPLFYYQRDGGELPTVVFTAEAPPADTLVNSCPDDIPDDDLLFIKV